jgi:hypothetical protein
MVYGQEHGHGPDSGGISPAFTHGQRNLEIPSTGTNCIQASQVGQFGVMPAA